MGRQALGRGLEALIPVGKEEPGIVEIPLVEIRPSPFQPRKRFDDKKLDELTASIRAQGVLSPVIVRQARDGYELVAGERRVRVANTLRLLKLPSKLREDVIEGTLSAGHGRALLALEGRELQLKAREAVIRRGLSVRATELLVKRLKAAPAARGRTLGRQAPGLAQAEEQLRRALATKVRIIRSGHRGRIEVEFYSEEDLDRLVQKICAP